MNMEINTCIMVVELFPKLNSNVINSIDAYPLDLTIIVIRIEIVPISNF